MTSNQNIGQQSLEALIDQASTRVEILTAVITLEYHDKNYLFGDDEIRCRGHLDNLSRLKVILCDIKSRLQTKSVKPKTNDNPGNQVI